LRRKTFDDRPAGQRVGVDRDLLESALAADPARGRRVEGPRARLARERSGDLHGVAREVGRRPGRARPVDEPLAVQEPERELLVVPGRAHGDREGAAVDADLERLLDGDLVVEVLRGHARHRAADRDARHRSRSSRNARASSARSSETLRCSRARVSSMSWPVKTRGLLPAGEQYEPASEP